MRLYLANLWLAIRGRNRFAEYVTGLEARVARAERRAQAQRDSRARRQQPQQEQQ